MYADMFLIELHHAWQVRSSKFFVAVVLVVLSTLCYLTASLMDPGYLPMTFATSPSLHQIKQEALKERAQVGLLHILTREGYCHLIGS